METRFYFKYFAPALAGVALTTILTSPSARAAVNVGSSSWVWQNPLPQGNSLKAITCSSSGSQLVCTAVGDLGTILFGDSTTGAPPTWSSQDSGTTQTLRAIACPDGNTCFAVGDGGTILATTNEGVKWTTQSSGVTGSLTGIGCQTTTHCFAVGSLAVLETKDGGATWKAYPNPGAPQPRTISCPDAYTCFVIAGNPPGSAVVEKISNGGATWPATVTTSDFNILTAISCGSTSHCVAVDIVGNSIATSDGGSSWGPVVPVTSATYHPSLYGISCWNALDCVAVGIASGSGYNLYWTNNSGSTWYGEASGKSPQSNPWLNGISCPGGTCVAVGEFGAMTTDYPIDFAYTGLESAVTSKQLHKVSCVNTNDCYAVGDDGIFATTNGGTTWTKQYSVGGLLGVNCPSATACFAVGANEIFATTNGGSTWTSQSLGGTSAVLAEVNCPNTTTCFAAGTSILSTTDGGKTWITEVIFSGGPGAFAIACTSTTSCVAVGYGGGIFHRSATSLGTRWSRVSPPFNTGDSLQDISCPEATYCIAVGDNGTTIISNDGGQTWKLQPYTTTKNLSSIGCLPASQLCYAATWDGFIFSSLGTSGWSPEAQQEWLLDGVSCAYLGADYRCVAVGDPGAIISKLHTQTTGGGGGGGGGGHCGTPSNPCPQ